MSETRIEEIGFESAYAARALKLGGSDLMGIMAECAQIIGEERFGKLMDASKAGVLAAFEGIDRAVENQFEQIMVASAVALSLTATVLSWVDMVNFETEIAEIEEGF